MVTLIALSRKFRCDVVRRLGGKVILHMARTARGAQTDKLSDGRILVTGLALDGGMRPEERKAIGVLLD